MRVCVIGSCQAEGMADWVRLLALGVEVEAFSIAGVDPDDADARRVWRAMLDRAEVVISQVGRSHRMVFGIPSAEALEAEGRRVLKAPWILFRGFHPDCVFLFDHGVIVNGAAGPHHSGVAVAACLEGLSEDRTLGLFNSLTYSALGYFDDFNTAAEVMTDQWQAAGLEASAWLTSPIRPFMRTLNHPVVGVLGDVAAQVLRRAGIDTVEPGEAPLDRLAAAGDWPIYPEFAARLGLAGSTAFTYPDRSVSRQEMVAGTYGAIEAMRAGGSTANDGVGHPASKPVIDRARAFIRDHVKR